MAIGVAAAIAALAVAAYYYSAQPFSSHPAITSYSAGDFTVSVMGTAPAGFWQAEVDMQRMDIG